MSKKRIGIAVMALGMFLWAAAAYASPEAPRLLSPPMALPVPSGFLKVLLLLTFFVHLVLVNVLLGSVILSVIDRRASASDRKGGVAFMPKVLALAVNFGERLVSLDLNPLMVLPEGQGVRIVDIVMQARPSGDSPKHLP